jgi:hypothetical protein
VGPGGRGGQRPLHPGFGAAWPALRALLSARPAVVVDAANVVGSVPDGWWKDRAGASERLRERLSTWTARGVVAPGLGVGADLWYPPVSMVVEGAAREIADAVDERVVTVRASGAGDDAIVEETRRLRDGGFVVTAITSDRGLRERLEELGAQVQSSSWLLERLG